MATPKELLDDLLKDVIHPEDLLGKNGLLKQLASIWILASAVYSGMGCQICARTTLKKPKRKAVKITTPLRRRKMRQ